VPSSFAFRIRPQDSAVVIEGTTIDSIGNPIQDVDVTVISLGLSVSTNARGSFRIALPEPGAYSLRVRRIGFLAQVIEVDANGPLVSLPPIVLRAAPALLPEVAVEGRLPSTTFYLSEGFHVSAEFAGPGAVDYATYETWDAHGAALSPNDLLAVRQVSPRAEFRIYGWYDPPDKRMSWYLIGAVGCPKFLDMPLATAWQGFTYTVLQLYRDGTVWATKVGPFNPGPRCRHLTSIASGRTLLNGGPMLGGWVTTALDSAGTAHLSLYSSTGAVVWDTAPPPFLHTNAAARRAHFAATPLGATIAAETWPFEWAELDASGGMHIKVRPFATAADSISFSRWTALPVLPIANGFVQTLTSPGAAERRIVLYDLRGRVISLSETAGAPGFIASDPTRRKLIGLRFSSAGRNRAEVVEYVY